MAQKPIELILLKELASHLSMAVFLLDTEGTVIFYNQPAEALLGVRYDETGEMPYTQLRKLISPTDHDGELIPYERSTVRIALSEQRPQQAVLWIHEPDGTPHRIATTAVPIEGQGGTPLGAMSIFWEVDAS